LIEHDLTEENLSK